MDIALPQVDAVSAVDTLGPCCWLELCCPPKEAAAGLADHSGIPVEYVESLLTSFVIVPRILPTTKAQIVDSDYRACEARLARLHRHVKRELIDILSTLGFPNE